MAQVLVEELARVVVAAVVLAMGEVLVEERAAAVWRPAAQAGGAGELLSLVLESAEFQQQVPMEALSAGTALQRSGTAIR